MILWSGPTPDRSNRYARVERIGSVDPALVAIEARRIADGSRLAAVVERPALRRFDRPTPSLSGYDALLAGSTR